MCWTLNLIVTTHVFLDPFERALFSVVVFWDVLFCCILFIFVVIYFWSCAQNLLESAPWKHPLIE